MQERKRAQKSAKGRKRVQKIPRVKIAKQPGLGTAKKWPLSGIGVGGNLTGCRNLGPSGSLLAVWATLAIMCSGCDLPPNRLPKCQSEVHWVLVHLQPLANPSKRPFKDTGMGPLTGTAMGKLLAEAEVSIFVAFREWAGVSSFGGVSWNSCEMGFVGSAKAGVFENRLPLNCWNDLWHSLIILEERGQKMPKKYCFCLGTLQFWVFDSFALYQRARRRENCVLWEVSKRTELGHILVWAHERFFGGLQNSSRYIGLCFVPPPSSWPNVRVLQFIHAVSLRPPIGGLPLISGTVRRQEEVLPKSKMSSDNLACRELLKDAPQVTKSESSVENLALWDVWRRRLTPKMKDVHWKCGTLRRQEDVPQTLDSEMYLADLKSFARERLARRADLRTRLFNHNRTSSQAVYLCCTLKDLTAQGSPNRTSGGKLLWTSNSYLPN